MQASYHSTDFTSAHIHESEVEGFEWLPEELRPHLQYMLGSPPNKRGRERERERERRMRCFLIKHHDTTAK
jgi:hypothetical protein